MTDRTAIVTGASSGIGRAIAEAFLQLGARVAVCARRVDRLEEIYGQYPQAMVRDVDVGEAEQVSALVGEVERLFGGVDILVNNAGALSSGRVEDMDLETWRQVYRVNVEAPFLFCKYAVPGMRRRNYGRIINMSSGGSVNCGPQYSLYASTKAALNAFTKSLSRELTGTNVKVNTMSPGPCKTEMFPDNPLEPGAAVPTAVFLATLPEEGPTGKFYWMMQEVPIIPDLSHVNWTDPASLTRKSAPA